jgi:hypothetical protein
MTVVRCTRNLLKEIDAPPTDIAEMFSQGPLGSWHANIFRIERRKSIIFTNDKTLYSLLIVDVKKEALRQFDDLFRNALFKAMRSIEIASHSINEIMDETLQFVIGKTTNRSVLGTMNDHVLRIKLKVMYDGGYQYLDIANLNKRLNETPTKAIGFATGEERIKKVILQHNKAL